MRSTRQFPLPTATSASSGSPTTGTSRPVISTRSAAMGSASSAAAAESAGSSARHMARSRESARFRFI